MERLKSGLGFIFSSYKRTAAILFVAALALAIPITITLVGQQQDVRQRAASPSSPCGSLGDVNGDGKVDSVDANLLLSYSAGKIPISRIVAANSDVNGDGKINSIDANLLLSYSAGLISTFTGCNTNVISGTVFIDTNGNGVQDSGETEYTGNATIKLQNGKTATKFGNGFYFTEVANGNYTVTLTLPSGYTKTTQSDVSVTVPPSPGTFKFGIKSTGTPSTPTPKPISILPTPTPTPKPISILPTPTPTRTPISTDRIPPTSVITSPELGSTQTGNFYVSVTDSDNTGGSGLAKCEYAVTDYNNGFTVGRTGRACNSQILITVGPNGNCRTEGINKCTVRADSTDNAGNLASLSFRSFSIAYAGTGGPPTVTPTPTRAPTSSPTPTTTPTTPCRIPASLNVGTGGYGDVNGDGQVTSVDSNLILQFTSGLIKFTPAQIEAADVNGSPNVLSSAGNVNSIDSTLILQYVAGLISTFPACPTPTTPTATPVVTATLTPTPTGIPSGTTSLSLSITLTGIGVSQNPALGINNNPKRPQRNVGVTIVNSGNQQVGSFNSTIDYDAATGKYKGNVNLGSNFVSGSYLVKVRFDNTLWKTIPGIQNITSGQTYKAPEATLVSGDIIQDNEINLLDYNALLSCFGTQACATKVQADLNDDDKVEELDLNILYAGFAKRVGD